MDKGICFVKFGDQERRNKRDRMQGVTAVRLTAEPGIEPTTEHSEEMEYYNTEIFESPRQFLDVITDEMLNACETVPSSEAYWNAYRKLHRFFTMKMGKYIAISLFFVA